MYIRRFINEKIWGAKRLAVMKRDRYVCQYCGSNENLSVDHIWPVTKGGTEELSNLITACKECNSSKGGKTLREWMQSFVRTVEIKNDKVYNTDSPNNHFEEKIATTQLSISVRKLMSFADEIQKDSRLSYARWTGAGRLLSREEYGNLILKLFELGLIQTKSNKGKAKAGFIFVENGVEKLCKIAGVEYKNEGKDNSDTLLQKIINDRVEKDKAKNSDDDKEISDEDLMNKSIELFKSTNRCSTSLIQISFSVGYTKASRIMKMMEDHGFIEPYQGAGSQRKLSDKIIIN